jgi:Tfp pilus assembly protein PilX
MFHEDSQRHRFQSQSGVALIMAVVVLTVLSVMIMGVSRDVDLDLGITQNIRLKNDAFNWSEAGMDIAEEVIAFALDTRGDDANTTFAKTVGSSNYTIQNPGGTLFLSNGTVTLSRNGQPMATSEADFLSTRMNEGGSIIIASGYEGAGKSASHSGVAVLYSIVTNGSSAVLDGQSVTAETYRFTGSGS